MDHKKVIANIKLLPSSNGETDIKIEMPIWIRKDEQGKFYANLALLGGIMTYADNEADLDKAINEAIAVFFENADKYGKGLQNELVTLGWQIKKERSLRFKVKRDRAGVSLGLPMSPAFQEVMQTGVSKTVSVTV